MPKARQLQTKGAPIDRQYQETQMGRRSFKKAERATEGAKATSEYNAEREAERAKTVRLKAQREAKEAADKVATQTAPAKKKR